MQLTFSDNRRPESIIPAVEMGAYEALWAEPGASFKTIAAKFKAAPNLLPSDLVSPEKIEIYKAKVFELIEKAKLKPLGIRVNGAAEYPAKLRDAKYPIELFYFKGNWDLAYLPSVAVIGTRHPTDEGKRRTAKLVQHMVRDKLIVTSGLAKGIDTVAHRSALKYGGQTMAVIGTALTESYPQENKALQNTLSQQFLLLSPVPFIRYATQTPNQNRLFFPERNKLMSAITQATIIVEAGETSGTLVQARAALEQGRKLFILDSCFKNTTITWPEKFAKQGAIRVKAYEDIREQLLA